MATIKPEQLNQQIKSGKIGGLYLFDGPENWLKDQAIQKIIDKFLPAEARDLNLDRFNGDSSSAAQVVNAAQSLPFLAERRVIVVQSGDEFTAAESKILGEALSNLPDSTILIFTYTKKASMRDPLVARVASDGTLITFWTPFPNQLPSWAVSEAKVRGKTLTFDAARALCEACVDLQEMSNELDKLILYVGKKTTVDISDVMTHGLPEGTGQYNDLEEAIWNRNLGEAMYQGHLLFEMGVRAESIFPVFHRVFRRLILARHYLDVKGWSRMDIYNTLGFRGKTRQGLLDVGLRKYGPNELKDALQKVINANLDLKTGLLSSDLAVSLLTLSLLGKKKELALR